jgi:hypothetical protein
MAGQVVGWGLWNERLTEWFNPGGRKPYFPTKEAAERMLPMAQRQYAMGKWELLEYALEDDSAAYERDATDPRAEARPDTETAAARRPDA